MKKIKKAIIPMAGFGTRMLPLSSKISKELLPIFDKPLLYYILDEVYKSGLEEVFIITSNNKKDIKNYFKENKELINHLKKNNKKEEIKKINLLKPKIKINFINQRKKMGLLHAIFCGVKKLKNEPFAIILPDDLIINKTKKNDLRNMIELFEKEKCSIIGSINVVKKDTQKYGILITDDNLIKKSIEKPKNIQNIKEFKNNNSFEAIVGRYIFTENFSNLLLKQNFNFKKEINILDLFDDLSKKEKILKYKITGVRYDIGSFEGYIKANKDLIN